jgi:hypothetical protein
MLGKSMLHPSRGQVEGTLQTMVIGKTTLKEPFVHNTVIIESKPDTNPHFYSILSHKNRTPSTPL